MSINIAMFKTIFHQYYHHAKKTFNWFPLDSEERYNENIKNNLNKLQEFDWVDSTFTYKFNSHGFRCDEFTEDPGIMFLGCSHTIGIGLPLENNWPTLVSNELNLKMINLGIGGSGADTAFRLANHYITQLQPKIVIYLESLPARLSLITQRTIHDFLPSIYPKEFEQFFLEWINFEENLTLNLLKHNLAIDSLCSKHNIKYIHMPLASFEHLDNARDLMHYGRKSNISLSKKVLDKIGRA